MWLAVHERTRFDVRCDFFLLFQDFCLIDFSSLYCYEAVKQFLWSPEATRQKPERAHKGRIEINPAVYLRNARRDRASGQNILVNIMKHP